MNRLLVLVFLALCAPGLAGAQARTAEATSPAAERDLGSGVQFAIYYSPTVKGW
jgi:hypothetical protein